MKVINTEYRQIASRKFNIPWTGVVCANCIFINKDFVSCKHPRNKRLMFAIPAKVGYCHEFDFDKHKKLDTILF